MKFAISHADLRTAVRRSPPSLRRGPGTPTANWAIALVALVAVLAAAGPALATDTWTTPHPGIRRLYRTASGPRRIHALVIDLCRAGVSIRATRSSERRQTVSSFATSVSAEAAINADFFSYADYSTSGAAASGGAQWGADNTREGFVAFGRERIDYSPPSEVVNPLDDWMNEVVGGHPRLVHQGASVAETTSEFCTARHPRTMAGFTRDRQTLILAVVDGRSSASIGMTCAEEARLLIELGAWDGLNLDGGGSSTMWIRGVGVVNTPSDGSQRVVGNHLAIQANGTGHAESCRPWEPEEASTLAQHFDASGTSDLDGDGRADLCGRAAAGLRCYLASGAAWGTTVIAGPELSDDSGWDDPTNYEPIAFGDVTGDGLADVCARANAGVRCWPSTGAGFGAQIVGPELSDANGWNAPARYATMRLADVDGDGKDDLCARGENGFVCWPSYGTSFGEAFPVLLALSDEMGFDVESGWSTIRMGDVDGDGKVDVCARGAAGFFCWRATGAGFDSTPIVGPVWSDENSWGNASNYLTIRLADVDGDGRADACARANAGFRCHLSTGAAFGAAIALDSMTNDQGWNRFEHYSTIRLGDIDGDGDRDVCGRATTGIACFRFDAAAGAWGERVAGPELSDDSGWARAKYYRTIELADVTGDGTDDVCARAAAGIFCWPGGPTGFAERIAGPTWSDESGWGAVRFHSTIQIVGPRREPISMPVDPGTVDGGLPTRDGGIGSSGDADVGGPGRPPGRPGGSDAVMSGGCAVTPAGNHSPAWLGYFLLAAAIVVRRRR